jgi:plastocyanin
VQGDDFPPGARQSIITNFAFEAVIEVEVGQRVYFNNSDSVPHTVTAGTPDSPDMAAFDSGILNPGDNIEFETSVAGTFRLFCALHNGMSTTVVVR